MIPTEAKMEDLSRLSKFLPTMVLNLALAQADKNINRDIALYRGEIINIHRHEYANKKTS